MNWAWYLIIFLLGSSVGSFLNVLVSRTISGENWVSGRSRCDYCETPLPWYQMIPIFSYVVSKGKSSCCHKSLSYQHIVVEILTGLLFVWWSALSSVFFLLVSQPGLTIQPLFWLLTGLVLLVISVSDQYYGVIPLTFVIVGVIMTIMYRLILINAGMYMLSDLWWSILGAAAMSGCYLLLRVITRGNGMGEGDVWLGIYLGLLVGWPRVWISTMSAFVLGAIVGLLLIIMKRKTRKDIMPFGPYMIMGAIVGLIWG